MPGPKANTAEVRDRAVEWVRASETAVTGATDTWTYYDGGDGAVWSQKQPSEWPPFAPMFIRGEDVIFPGSGENDTVAEWVHTTVSELNTIYREAGPEKGWLMVRNALGLTVAARIDSPLNIMEHAQWTKSEAQGDTTVLRGSVNRADLVGSDLPRGAVDRSRLVDPNRRGASRDVALTVSNADGAPVSG